MEQLIYTLMLMAIILVFAAKIAGELIAAKKRKEKEARLRVEQQWQLQKK